VAAMSDQSPYPLPYCLSANYRTYAMASNNSAPLFLGLFTCLLTG
jgi:hypothetical protein